MQLNKTIILISIWINVVLCIDTIKGHINGTAGLPIEADIRISIFSNTQTDKSTNSKIPVTIDGKFEIPISSLQRQESYLIQISSTKYVLHPQRFRLDIGDPQIDMDLYQLWKLDIGDEFNAISDQNKVQQSQQIEVQALTQRQYIEPRFKPIWESGIVMMIRKNPILIAIAVILVMFAFLPTFISYIDPETAAEIQASVAAPSNTATTTSKSKKD